ncbi:MAG TPA: ankyrin repeat domain-containing protein [Polyangiaceae bacterium]|nr:ankyrin repeat domain-containing protein [Polyangiaceae bacterium]
MIDTELGVGFEGLRKLAKRWLKAIRGGDLDARAKFDALVSQHSTAIGLREVQQALARQRGFASWASLKEHFELEGLAANRAALRDEFLHKACIGRSDDGPGNWKRAARILARHPELARENIYSAVLCGELERVQELLDADPKSVNQKGGTSSWEPLLFLCYCRLPNERAAKNSLAVARLLLDRGADPNAYFIGDGGDAQSQYRFTALTGVMGQGELAQPEHPEAKALAHLLLEAGADANDSQALYNTCLRGDEARWLELLFEFGLDNRTVNWATDPHAPSEKRPGNLDFIVVHAAANGQMTRLEFLLAHGADPNAVSSYTGKTCYESALLAGHDEAAALLVKYGAGVKPLEGLDAFIAASSRGDRRTAEELVRRDPEYLEDTQPLVLAAGHGNREAVRILLELGMNPNRPGKHDYLALNNGASHRAVCELLLAHGADPRGRTYNATAAGWALHRKEAEMGRFLAEKSRLLLDACMTGHVALARELLASDPSCVRERSPVGSTPLHLLPEDVDLAEELIDLLLAHGADSNAKNDAGQTPREALEANGHDEIADRLDARSS